MELDGCLLVPPDTDALGGQPRLGPQQGIAWNIELWAGAECTVNRVGERYRDQLRFTGLHDRPDQLDLIAELGAYGRSKAIKAAIQNLPRDHLVLRTAAFFSPHDEWNFAIAVVRALRAGRSFAATPSCTVSPTYVPALCDAVLDLLLDGETGLRHAPMAKL